MKPRIKLKTIQKYWESKDNISKQDLVAYHWEFGKTVRKYEDFVKLSRKLRVHRIEWFTLEGALKII